jgi:hypothetical protein
MIFILAATLACHVPRADENRRNHGGDPFFQISDAIADCPVPLGPNLTDEEWAAEAHHRVERGNSCWVEGRCRLSNGYLYDKEIAEAVQRRLTDIGQATRWREGATLWLLLQRRFIYVQRCVSPAFDKRKFLAELAKTADVEEVIDQTTVDPKAASLPYRTAQ